MYKRVITVLLVTIMALGICVGCSNTSGVNKMVQKNQDTSSKSNYSKNYLTETISNSLSEIAEDNSASESSIEYILSKDYEMKIETDLKGLQFEIPKDWEKIAGENNYTYYYPEKNNFNFVFLAQENKIDVKLSERVYLNEFENQLEQSEDVKKIISKKNLTVSGKPCLNVIYESEINNQDYIQDFYVLINDNDCYSFISAYLKSKGNKYKDVFDNLIDSINFVNENSEVELSEIESSKPETSKNDNSNSEFQNTEKVIYDKNNIKIVYKGIDDEYTKNNIKLYIENNLSYDIIIQDRDFSINGYMFSSTHLSPTITSGKKINKDMSIYSYELEENGIDKIKDVELKFLIVDKNDYSRKIETEAIKFSV